MSALSASTPIHKCKLVDWDLRYNIICQSVDDRTANERDPNHEDFLPKSRYSGVSHYISEHEFVKEKHNDTQYKINSDHFCMLQETLNLDERLAYHISQLFIRDPIPAYEMEVKETPCEREYD